MSTEKVHPLVVEARDVLPQGGMSRRDFLRLAALLGVSAIGANALAACGSPAAPTAPAVTNPTAAPQAAIVRGGTLTLRSRVERADHPARFSLVSQSHPWRHVFEYLTQTDAKGITHPYLLENWEASEDLKTWKLKVRQGIKFSNGKTFTADDVVFNFQQWLSEEVGSALLGQMSYLRPDGVEKVDDYNLTLHLTSPTIFLPEHLFHYAAAILPATFGGDITREPIGTGPFTVKEYVPGERCRLVRREDYWQNGEDGKPLPYLDEIVMVHLGDDPSAWLSALKSNQVEMVVEPPVTLWEGVKDDPTFTVLPAETSATRVLRVRADQEPWTNPKVRQALKYCHNREKILAVALRNQGVIGNDSHVSPVQPEFVDIAPLPFDPAKSKALLAEAGYGDGVTVELAVASDWPESMAYAQALKEDAAAGGFTINLKVMPATQYWDGWTDFNMGITWWAHRPLAPMTLTVAYTGDAEGKPGAWNEAHWIDDEFSDLAKQAEGTLDVAARREIVGKMEQIMIDRGPICVPFFMNVWQIYTKAVHGVEPSPEEFCILHRAWKDKA
ncbi:MAG TPA: ABC transporter substrate-binding protein [Anaerolineae bacterium]|nr:ABC transporter substrate-binding protein [Anaerolineae bacterium]